MSKLELSCPFGGHFYVCVGNATEFLGCCTTDPCANGSGSCPTENLRYSSFSADQYGNIPTEDCEGSTGLWYACEFANPPFLGCCTTNACSNDSACPQADLVAAKLDANEAQRTPFLSAGSTATAQQPGPGGSTRKLSGGVIAGIAVGALVVLAILAAIAWRCRYHSRQQKRPRSLAIAPVSPDPNLHTLEGKLSQYSDFSPPSNTLENGGPFSRPSESYASERHSRMSLPTCTDVGPRSSRNRFSDVGLSSPRLDSHLRHISNESGVEHPAPEIVRQMPELGDNTRFELAGNNENREKRYIPYSPPSRPTSNGQF